MPSRKPGKVRKPVIADLQTKASMWYLPVFKVNMPLCDVMNPLNAGTHMGQGMNRQMIFSESGTCRYV